jgi:hypothetical protein
MSLNFETANKTFRDIMGNGLRYVVPKFQRDYSWTSEQWEDLWQDIQELLKDDAAQEEHYMGYLLLQSHDRKEYSIIDGQQRISTLSIFILAVLNHMKRLADQGIEPEDNQKRLETLKSTYIGFTDPVSLVTKPKLTLNRNNDRYFGRYLCTLTENPPIRGTKASEKLLQKAYCFFLEKIEETAIRDGAELAALIGKVVDRLLFTQITVGSDLNAYTVFETLNARGIKLSVPDLLKNYLFSIIDGKQPLHQEEIRQLEEEWQAITDQLGSFDFSKFMQSEWNSRNPIVVKNSLFKKIKQSITTREQSFGYLQNLGAAAEVYAALQSPTDIFWQRDEYYGVQNSLRSFELFNISQPFGLLMAAYRNFTPKEFVKIAKYIEVVSIRYNVIGRLSPNKQENIYNKIACGISDKSITNLKMIQDSLREIYPSDNDFRNDFAHKQMRTEQSTKKVRFLLARIEESLNNGMDITDTTLTLEHILPSNPKDEWLQHFDASDVDSYADMIGNMTLLQESLNKELRNAAFPIKKEVFAKSSLEITRWCGKYTNWTKESIEARQKWLAEQAVLCWKIDALSSC